MTPSTPRTAFPNLARGAPRPTGSPLFRKYASLLLGLVGGVLLLNAAIEAYYSYVESRAALVAVQHEKARGAAAVIEQYINGIEGQIGWTTHAGIPQDAQGAEQRRFDLLRLLRQAPAITELQYLDAQGREQQKVSRLTMDMAESGTDLSGDIRFTQARTNRRYVSPVYFRKESEPYLTMAVAGQGRSSGVTIAEVNLKFIWDVVSRIKIGKAGTAYVVDRDGLLIAHPDIGLVLRKTDVSRYAHVAAARAAKGDTAPGVVASDWSGREVLSASASIETLQWHVLVDLPVKEAFEPIWRALRRSGAFVLGALGVAALAGLWLARRMTVPIAALAAGAQRVGSGDLDHRIDIRTGDEIESLAASFNDMSAQLKAYYAGLESTVAERTRELREALDHETATGEVLGAISRSPNHLQPVLDTLVATASRLCNAPMVAIHVLQEGDLPGRARCGFSDETTERLLALKQGYDDRGSLTGRVMLERRAVHIPDTQSDPEYTFHEFTAITGARSMLGVPLISGGEPRGILLLYRTTPTAFTPRQIALMESFADQAVIAIENARLFEAEQTRTRELKDSLNQQTATAEVLKAISRSAFDLRKVLDTLADSAAALCDARDALIFQTDGDELRLAAHHGSVPVIAPVGTLTVPISPAHMTGRAVLDRQPFHVEDIFAAGADRFDKSRELARRLGWRAALSVPLLRGGEAVGAIFIRRAEPRAFSARQIELAETFADQAVIAIENARLFEAEQTRTRELRDSLEYQTAISDVLAVISKSPNELQPVIDAIVTTAHQLCQAEYTLLAKRGSDGMYHVTASKSADPEFIDWVRARPMAAGDGSMIGIVAADARTTHFPDCLAEPRFTDLPRQQRSKARTMLGVPLLRGGEANGVIFLARTTVHPFTQRQIALVTTFADQAVIAIENTRLFEAEQTRTKQLTESLEYQTAMADVLGVISRSQFALEPVLQSVVDTAARLCHADKAIVYRQSDGAFRYVAGYGKNTPAYLEIERSTPIEAGPGTLVGRTALAKAPVQIADALSDPAYEKKEDARIGLLRTMLGVPLMRDGEVMGIIALGRELIRPFETREIALVETFADQAVIAFENTRLFEAEQTRTNELQESLKYQTAISEVLAVISRSPGNVQPVLDAILSTAQELCEADRSSLWRLREGTIELAAHHDHWPGQAGYLAHHPVPNDRTSLAGRVISDKRTIHITDRLSDSSEIPANEQARAMQARTMLGVPLLLDGQAIGSMGLVRNVVRPFSERQVKLVETFADQAVIAIENARLFEAEQTRTKELQQSLERQTATAQVLGVISRSPNEVQPVLDTIVTTARALCQAERAIIWRLDDETFSPVAHDGLPDDRIAAVKSQTYPADRTSMVGRAVIDKRAVQVADVLADPELAANRDFWQAGNVRAVLATPLLSKGVPIGAITVSRTRPWLFDETQVGLVESFADQAVIAIENARLFEAEQTRTKELQESLEYQTATSEVLGVISKSPNDLQPVLDAITETAASLCDAEYAHFRLLRDGAYHVAADHGYRASDVPGADGGVDALRQRMAKHAPILPGRDSVAGRAALECRTIQIENIMEDAAGAYSKAIDPTPRTVLGVPLVKGGVAVGVIMLFRRKVQPFNGRQIALVNTFAEQALIAMENTRLFEEVQTRTKELQESLEYQTATSEVLGVISKSPNSVEPVFEAIITMAERLCHADFGFVYRRGEDGRYHLIAAPRATPEYRAYRQRHPIEPNDGSILGDALHARRLVHVSDVRLDPKQSVSKTHEIGRIRSALAVPLISAGAPVGVIGVIRSEPNAFTRRQIALVETFADQAVIAIENARLLKEIQDRSAELARTVGDLKALSEIGQAVSSSLDPKTVLSLVVERAAGLAAADAGIVFHFDEGDQKFGLVETFGLDAASRKAFHDVGTAVARTAMSPAITRRSTMQIEDLRALSRNPVTDLAIERGLYASLTVPLVAGDRMLGTLTILRRRTGAFAPGVVAMIESFANQSAIALQNARLFDEIAEKSRQIEIASQHKSQFLANMSHELRTPLNAILGYTELMQDGIYGDLPEKAASVLSRVQTNGRHLLGLINSVLDLSKIEAGQLVLDRSEYAMDAVVQNAVVATESLATEKRLTMTVELAAGLPRGVGDERRLSQVLLNLIGNAIKFTDKGGVRIAASCVNGRFRVAVADTGPGIPADHLERIFEEFHQVDSSNTKEKGGTGLGLSIAKRIVEMHGGRIWVESEPGRGATFTFEVPVEAPVSQGARGPGLEEVS